MYGSGHPYTVLVVHPRSTCDAEHTGAHKIYPFTAVYMSHRVNRVDSVHTVCCY
ncbi:hypothetical protein STRTUCAR8_06643 [Streptomyces turgidiscabies Car8]|uniref:Uncharacterized protein n=1 Tax=Streptomyces turgidiscabies (strain Car8) TaxID=698760 RepID=L7EVF2_STRT8|nr:hypothetical protein STRTUCAR8_06643 [Streptomyces turgidiscabies Car8]